jgi:COP9 signalosome complex subunit 6
VRTVYNRPQLELVGWATLIPESGPQQHHLAVHWSVAQFVSDVPILLGLHPESILDQVGGQLPVTIYDSSYPAPFQKKTDQDEAMRDAAADTADEVPLERVAMRDTLGDLRTVWFHKLSYTIETGEAEMIGMQFVHRGAANASAAPSREPRLGPLESDDKGKGKALLDPEDGQGRSLWTTAPTEEAFLTNEESDLIAALGAKKNAIQMLKRRVDLFIIYLENLPSETVNTEHVNNAVNAAQDLAAAASTKPSNTILRAIQALKTNLSLLSPTSSLQPEQPAQPSINSQTQLSSTLETEMLRETNDVHLVSLLGDVLQSIDDVREAGKHFSIVDGARAYRSRMPGEPGHGGSSNLPGDLAHLLH